MSQIKQEFDAVMTQLTCAGAPFELARDNTGPYFVNAPATLVEALAPARQHGEREFLVYEGERFSFTGLMDDADALAVALQSLGVQPGDRVGLAMRNYPEWMISFIAVTTIGAVIVPINSWGKPADIAFTLGDAEVSIAICDQPRYNGVAEFLQEQGIIPLIARPDDDQDSNSLHIPLNECRGKTPQAVAIDPQDLAIIMYTSGTTGKPKGAASTHRAISQALYNFECASTAAAMCNGETIGAMLERGFEPTSLLAVPLFHVSGCHAQFLSALRGGRRIVMMYKWDVDRALQYIEEERITTIAAAPAMIMDLLESPHFDSTDTGSLFSLGIGGAATPPRVTQLIATKMPENFSGTGWGMTETNAQGASLTGKAFAYKPGSAGVPHPIVEIEIRDDAGQVMAAGEPGEIWVRSCTNIREYWNRPEANAEEFENGYLKTGDIGFLDEEGFLFLSDRAKDMIIRGGENIFPIEIENLLLECDEVKELVAIGLPDERLGEEVAVVVRLHPGKSLSEEALLSAAREGLASYKVPSKVFFIEQDLPRNATNKVLKLQVKAEILASL